MSTEVRRCRLVDSLWPNNVRRTTHLCRWSILVDMNSRVCRFAPAEVSGCGKILCLFVEYHDTFHISRFWFYLVPISSEFAQRWCSWFALSQLDTLDQSGINQIDSKELTSSGDVDGAYTYFQLRFGLDCYYFSQWTGWTLNTWWVR